MFCAREVNLESGAAADLAIDPDVTTILLENAVDGSESKAGPFSDLLGGEEGLKNSGDRGLVHADTSVADGEQDIVAFLHGEMLCSEDLVQFDGSSFENEFSASRHGVARVHSQVENDLIQLARVNLDDRGRTTRYHRDLDIISHERADKFHNVFESNIQVDQLGLQARFPSEGQQLACEGSAALDGFTNIAYVLTRVASGIDAVAKQFGAGGDDAENVIEIVSNPSC